MQGREFIGFMITLTLDIIMVIVMLLWMGGKSHSCKMEGYDG